MVVRTPVLSNCDERFTNNRMRGPLPDSGGAHHFAPGELARVDNLHLQRSRIDLLVELSEPLRIELRDGPFQLFEHVRCRVELQLPAPRAAVKQGDLERLGAVIESAVEGHAGSAAAAASALANRRRAEPLPADHEARWADYRAWQHEQLVLALRNRLAEALDRAGRLLAGAARGGHYAAGLSAGLTELAHEPTAACPELAGVFFSPRRGEPPPELDDAATREWRRGFADGQRLAFEIALAQRLERCLP